MAFGWGYSDTTGYGAVGSTNEVPQPPPAKDDKDRQLKDTHNGDLTDLGTISEGGSISPTLNHNHHTRHADIYASPLEAHEWVHVAAVWETDSWDESDRAAIYFNETYMTDTAPGWWYPVDENSHPWNPYSTTNWTVHDDGSQNTWRLGAVSQYYGDQGTEGYKRNWPADATVDELYLWVGIDAIDSARSLWQKGRYYDPGNSGGTGGGSPYYFTSGEITFSSLGGRSMPPPTPLNPPVGSGGGGGGAIPATPPAIPTAGQVRLLGVAWTWYGEYLKPAERESFSVGGGDLLQDHRNYLQSYPTRVYVEPEVKVTIETSAGPVAPDPNGDEGFSKIHEVVDSPFKYRVQFNVPNAPLLVATPVFDDITIYYQTSESVYETYIE
jgi:hypothetical protein